MDGRDFIDGVTFAPDGKLLAITGSRGKIQLWDVSTGEKRRQVAGGPRRSGGAVVFSADGNVLAKCSDNNDDSEEANRVYVWETATGKELGRFEPLAKEDIAPALSPDGKVLAVWGDGIRGRAAPRDRKPEKGIIQRWEVATGKELARIEVEGGIEHAAFSPDGKVLAAISTRMVRLLDTRTAKGVRQLPSSIGLPTFLAFSPDGKVLVAGGYDGALAGWDLATGNALDVAAGPKCQNGALAFAEGGRLLGWGVEGNTVCLWDARTGQVLTPRVGHRSAVVSLGFTSDAQRLVSGSPDGQVCIWDLATGKERHRFKVPGDDLMQIPLRAQSGLVMSPDGRFVAARQRAGPVLLWESATGTYVIRLVQDPSNPLAGLAAYGQGSALPVFSPDGRVVAVGTAVATGRARRAGFTNSVQLWELASRAVRAEFVGHTDAVTALAFSADGRLLASGSADTTILIWDRSSHAPGNPAVQTKLTTEQFDDLWAQLKTPDAPAAFQAMQTLVAAPREAVPYLARALLPDPNKTPDAAAIARLIADLDNNDFAVREKASRALEGLGRSALGALRQALAQKPSPEATRRLKHLLDRLDEEVQEAPPKRPDTENPQRRQLRKQLGDPGEPNVPPPAWGTVRLQRAVEVLETIANPEAIETLARLAKGHRADPLTQEAKEAVRRLAQRGVAP
jgi:WD40 repeat protein